MRYFLLIFLVCQLSAFEKVIIWGHKLHSHTHSYIHEGFYNAFVHLGYPTYWLDDSDDVSDYDFSNALFLTEGQVDHNIPLRSDAAYLLHNCTDLKYHALDKKNVVFFQVFTDSIFAVPSLVKLDTCMYYDLPGRCLYMPWATDLLPDEIEALKDTLKDTLSLTTSTNQVFWIGTIGAGKFGNIDQLTPFRRACEENGISFIQKGTISRTDHIACIRSSYIAPAIVGAWQEEQGYIPCRLFKNISYGKMGVTNSRHAYELFEKKIVYNPDTYQLFYDAKERFKTLTLEEAIALMDFVKTKHTFVQRIQMLLDFLQRVRETY
jgi:hypothetical protein